MGSNRAAGDVDEDAPGVPALRTRAHLAGAGRGWRPWCRLRRTSSRLVIRGGYGRASGSARSRAAARSGTSPAAPASSTSTAAACRNRRAANAAGSSRKPRNCRCIRYARGRMILRESARHARHRVALQAAELLECRRLHDRVELAMVARRCARGPVCSCEVSGAQSPPPIHTHAGATSK